eukprot:TRINITY_DN1936_c0_g1_i1.p1 TRINITY_DN1936_c0_g1~~TRINITY_DN1936_c0_g1_i1.p1  ORF type:complete len:348 (+),score=101.17 TRINITY_DN1936_c0_g1_i1:48-1091(+)
MDELDAFEPFETPRKIVSRANSLKEFEKEKQEEENQDKRCKWTFETAKDNCLKNLPKSALETFPFLSSNNDSLNSFLNDCNLFFEGTFSRIFTLNASTREEFAEELVNRIGEDQNFLTLAKQYSNLLLEMSAALSISDDEQTFFFLTLETFLTQFFTKLFNNKHHSFIKTILRQFFVFNTIEIDEASLIKAAIHFSPVKKSKHDFSSPQNTEKSIKTDKTDKTMKLPPLFSPKNSKNLKAQYHPSTTLQDFIDKLKSPISPQLNNSLTTKNISIGSNKENKQKEKKERKMRIAQSDSIRNYRWHPVKAKGYRDGTRRSALVTKLIPKTNAFIDAGNLYKKINPYSKT